MKNLILLAGLFLTGAAFSQDISFDNGTYTKNQVAYSGKHTLYYASGAIKEELNIKDGKLMERW